MKFSSHQISGTTAVELLSCLHWYLKYWCGAHISWSKIGEFQFTSVPKSGFLPHVQDVGIIVKRPIPWSYYQNAVSSSSKETPKTVKQLTPLSPNKVTNQLPQVSFMSAFVIGNVLQTMSFPITKLAGFVVDI